MKNIAIITGASSGIGKEFAKQISNINEFDEIWIIARRLEKLEELAKEINETKNFKLVRPVQMDICGKDGVQKLNNFLISENRNLNKIESGLNIKLLINNAGVGTYGPFIETPIEKEMDLIDLNCTTLTGVCGITIPFMKKDSVIINTASLAGFLPLGNFAVYAASKSYVLSFSIALAAELKNKGIKVCALCPGSVSTEFANVASNGARKEVKNGIPPKRIVTLCLKQAFNNKKVSLYKIKWKITAFFSHFIGRYLCATFTYKFNKRPYKSEKEEEIIF